VDAVELAAAVTATVPSPEPLAPLVTVSHAAPLVAVHVHSPGAVTITAKLPPAATMLIVVADSV